MPSYSAVLNVAVNGASLRGRARVLLAFQRPDALRLEVPGAGGAALVAVTRGGRLWAVFPGERAWFEGPADATVMESLLGVGLEPREIMDLLVGAASARLSDVRLGWGARLPLRVAARLPDGTRLSARVEAPEAPAELAAAAFEPPGHVGYRRLESGELRSLWSRR